MVRRARLRSVKKYSKSRNRRSRNLNKRRKSIRNNLNKSKSKKNRVRRSVKRGGGERKGLMTPLRTEGGKAKKAQKAKQDYSSHAGPKTQAQTQALAKLETYIANADAELEKQAKAELEKEEQDEQTNTYLQKATDDVAEAKHMYTENGCEWNREQVCDEIKFRKEKAEYAQKMIQQNENPHNLVQAIKATDAAVQEYNDNLCGTTHVDDVKCKALKMVKDHALHVEMNLRPQMEAHADSIKQAKQFILSMKHTNL